MKDITLTDTYDFEIIAGDFYITESTAQHIELILYSKQGEWKEFPVTGGNLQKAQNGTISRELDRHLRIQFAADGFQTESLQMTEYGILIAGKYIQ